MRSRRARACPSACAAANMKKNGFVLAEMRRILTSLTRGLSFDVLSSGYGEERGVPISFQAQSPVLGLVLPSNSPGVHTLWLPIIPMQIGLVLKPGPAGAVDAVPHGGGVLPGGHPARSHLGLSRRRRRRRRGPRALRARADLRRHGDGRSLPRQPQGPGARSGLLQDPPRRRRGRQLGEVSRPDGRERLRQQRPRLHQLLRHLGQPAHARDRRRAGASGWPPFGRSSRTIPTPASPRSRSPAPPTRSPPRSTPA